MGGKTKQIMAGGVAIGGGAPLSIQSMTNTKTADAEGTLAQLERLDCRVDFRIHVFRREDGACSAYS